MEKGGIHQAHNNQPHRLVVWVEEEGHMGQGEQQWQSERWGTRGKGAGRKVTYAGRWG